MATPPPASRHWSVRRLTLPQRLAAGCGCVTVLAVLAALALYAYFEYQIVHRIEAETARAPSGWADSIRALGRLPDLSGLTLADTAAGDGAAAAHDSAWHWGPAGADRAYRALVGGDSAPGPDVRAVWRAVASDTALDRFVAAARRREWHALDRVLQASDSVAHRNFMALPMPDYRSIRTASRGLVIRAVMRARAGDRAGARTDLGAAVTLGAQMFRHEPSLVGTLTGRAVIASGAHGWELYARAVRDSALEARAATIVTWATERPSTVGQWLLGVPDTALAIASDSTLALGLRADALANVVLSYLLRPRGFVFGVPGRYTRALNALGASGDRDAATLARIAATTAERANLLHMNELIQEAGAARR